MELLKRERGDYMSTTLRGVIYTILSISIILIIFLVTDYICILSEMITEPKER